MLRTACFALATADMDPNVDYAASTVIVPLIKTREVHDEEEGSGDDDDVFPLPASRYRYSKWHELNEMEVRSDMLHAPRIRRGPKGYTSDTIWMMEEQEKMTAEEEDDFSKNKKLWKKKKKQQMDYKSKLETWEQCEKINLSYQDLAQPYQVRAFNRVLNKLIRAETVELIENGLSDLSSVYLPNCRNLYLQRNTLKELKKLPQTPLIEHLSLQQNSIDKLIGNEILAATRLRSLVLQDNPICLKPGYRRHVFETFPSLQLLDGLPKTPIDDQEETVPGAEFTVESRCTVS